VKSVSVSNGGKKIECTVALLEKVGVNGLELGQGSWAGRFAALM